MTLLQIEDTVHLSKLTKQEVYELQTLLFELGYNVEVDGIYGEDTRDALEFFKKDNDLRGIRGYIGATTVVKLFEQYDGDDLLENDTQKFKPLELKTPFERKTIADIDWTKMNCAISKWFVVGEVFNGEQQRITEAPSITKSIWIMANELDKIRTAWGSGIGVTSWYRPPAINRRVGGVTNSRHIYGDGVDIYPMAGDIRRFQPWLDERWFGGFTHSGYRKKFVHLDMRNRKGWKTGGKKA